LPRTRLFCRDRDWAALRTLGGPTAALVATLAAALMPLLMPLLMAAPAHAAKLPLQCRLHGPAHVSAGGPVWLEMTWTNVGPQALDVLVWGTPFEAKWFAPYVEVRRGHTVLAYGGAMVKRSEPRAADYLRLEPGQQQVARFDLANAFDLSVPGRYKVLPQLHLQDVIVAGSGVPPRSRDLLVGQALACNALSLQIAR
jgi:hypothetical protein